MKNITEAVNDLAKAWMYNDGTDLFSLNDIMFSFVYRDTRKGERYEVHADGKMIGWNSCHKDFRTIGITVNNYMSN